MRILCVAEKPSIAKALASALGGGQLRTRNSANKYIKNYDISYNFRQWGSCEVTVTSVLGHLMEASFAPPNDGWGIPPKTLFNAAIKYDIPKDKAGIAKNIVSEARSAQVLYIWTDCDREGENIGAEIMQQAVKSNRQLQIVRATFNNVDPDHLRQAANDPGPLNQNLVDAVSARQELDLRTGFAFTRFQSSLFKSRIPELRDEGPISYGACQFPTLGFVVDRYLQHKKHKPEKFWHIELTVKANGESEKNDRAKLKWERGRLFDHMSATVLYERCLEQGGRTAYVKSATSRPTTHSRPLPLTTVQLQKQGAKFLKLSSKKIMDIAEKLYNRGFISYPRTETDSFDDAIDVQKLVKAQERHSLWGGYARSLSNGAYVKPRVGKNNDKSHPPIHPIKAVTQDAVDGREAFMVYEYITRHFLACCSADAKGLLTSVKFLYGEEQFHTSGIVVTARNFLEVYPYDKWSSSALPNFASGEEVPVVSCMLRAGETTAPPLLTEPELITLMDANGIGTDATIADHIQKVKDRKFIIEDKKLLYPMNLGIALVAGYDALKLAVSVTKPDLRRETEEKVTSIAQGVAQKQAVLEGLVGQYSKLFDEVDEKKETLITVGEHHLRNASSGQ